MKQNIYDIKGKLEAVTRRIDASDQISERTRQLIFDFCEHRRLHGSSNPRLKRLEEPSRSKQRDAVLSGVPFLSSPPEVVKRMLKLASVGPGDVVYDLGCGDGRILIAAVEAFKAKEAIGYKIRDDVYKKALEEVTKANLQERIRIVNSDFFEADLSRPSVITLYVDGLTNGKLKQKLEKETSPGTRIVSHDFPMPGWQPLIENTFPDHSHTIYLYVAPAAFSKKGVT